jgi:predicted DsbA family dithiol-disulfide isomerase
LFNALLIDKTGTGRNNGGNEDIYNETNNRKEFAEALQLLHPDIVKVTWKFNRWHHDVNYKIFKQKLQIKESIILKDIINNYGMELKKIL